MLFADGTLVALFITSLEQWTSAILMVLVVLSWMSGMFFLQAGLMFPFFFLVVLRPLLLRIWLKLLLLRLGIRLFTKRFKVCLTMSVLHMFLFLPVPNVL
mmetsp:Transcript_55122/g.145515  ORF Transcript_55122/g.145515 Transcript_55122/m.145515 type:complete len:100 (+) Transcript_55122:307-606(+)